MEPRTPRGLRAPNQHLAERVREGWLLERRMGPSRQRRGRGGQGLDPRYDKTSVARRLRGQRPRSPTPALIAEALGRKLGRTVTVEEVGMADERDGGSAVRRAAAAGVLLIA